MPKIVANPKRELTAEVLPSYLQHYLAEKNLLDELNKKVAGMKATLMDYLDEHGIENQNGHKVIVVDGVATITRQRRLDEEFLEDVAERWLKKKGKRDEVIKEVTIEEFDYDAFMGLLYDEKVPQAEVDRFYDRSWKYAFTVTGRTT